MDLPLAKAIYRAAVDARAADSEGDTWWEEVRAELCQVLDARSATQAAACIAWWHSDLEWQAIADTPKAAAQRIRAAARAYRCRRSSPA